MPRPTVKERFWQKVDKNGPVPMHRPDLGPCHVWIASKNPKGYGQFNISNNRNRTAHRAMLELSNIQVPEGLVVDHLCRNRACVRLSHLEFVTNRENVVGRGMSPELIAHREDRCVSGRHKLTPDNVHLYKGGRKCRACANERFRRRLATDPVWADRLRAKRREAHKRRQELKKTTI